MTKTVKLKLSVEKARSLYPDAPGFFREVLEENFGKSLLADYKAITDYTAVCGVLNLHPVNDLPYPSPNKQEQEAINGFTRTIRTIEVINGGWEPDWGDSNQRKYTLWYDMRPASAGGSASGFAFYGVDFGRGASDAGSRLVFGSEEKAHHYAKHFLPQSRSWMVKELTK